MATTSYDINVNTSQAIKSVKELNNALIGLATGAAVKGFVDLIDSASRLQNKLSLVAKDGQTSAQAFGLMIQSANKLGVPLAQLSDLYFTIAQNTKDLGLSQLDQIKLTENLTKGFTMAGLSASGAAAAVLQLGQSFAKGGPQAEEMTTIIEQLPLVAEQLSKKFGVTTGALKYLASQGKISSQDLVDAANKAGDAMDKAYRDRMVTVSESVNVFNNVLSALADKLNKDEQFAAKFSGAILAIAEAIVKVVDFFKEWGGTIVTVLEVLAALLIPLRVITAAVSVAEVVVGGFRLAWFAVQRAMMGVMGTIPLFQQGLGVLFPTLRTLVGQVIAFVGTIMGMLGLGSVFAKLNDWWEGLTNEKNKETVERLNNAVGATGNASEDAAKSAEKLKNQFDLINADNLDKAVKSMQQSLGDIKSTLRFDTAGTILGEEQKGRLQIQTDAAKKYSEAILKIQESYEKNKGGNFADQQAKEIEKVTEKYQQELTTVNELYDAKLRTQHLDELRKFTLQQQYDTQDKLKALQDDINKSTMTDLEQKYYDIKSAADEAAKAEIRAAAERRGIKVEDMPTAEVDAYYKAAYQGMDKLVEKTKEQYDVSRQFSTGWNKAFNSYVDDATNAAKLASTIFEKTTKGMEDMIVNFAKTGKFTWKEFVASMMEELLRSQVRQLMASMFTSMTPSTGSTIGGLLGFAGGGIIPTNGPVLVGERGPEIISGAAGRTVTPNNQLGQSTYVTYNINAVDTASFKSLVARDPGFIYAVTMQGAKTVPGGR